MFPGMGGINPKKMQAMMKQMGIDQDEIEASKVVIEKNDGGKIVINNPSVTKIDMQGQTNFQVSGDISEEEGVDNAEEDIKTIVEKTGVSEDEAKKALSDAEGDLTEALLNLS